MPGVGDRPCAELGEIAAGLGAPHLGLVVRVLIDCEQRAAEQQEQAEHRPERSQQDRAVMLPEPREVQPRQRRQKQARIAASVRIFHLRLRQG